MCQGAIKGATKQFGSNKSEGFYGWIYHMWKETIHRLMEVSVMMAPKTSKSQVGADFCCGWGNCHICQWGAKWLGLHPCEHCEIGPPSDWAEYLPIISLDKNPASVAKSINFFLCQFGDKWLCFHICRRNESGPPSDWAKYVPIFCLLLKYFKQTFFLLLQMNSQIQSRFFFCRQTVLG